MSTLAPADLLTQLRWRYAVKAFDPTRAIPADVWAALEESLVLTPSSFGLQPWRFVVVTDQLIKDQLPPFSWNQGQVRDASHVVVFAARVNPDGSDIDRLMQRTAEVRGVEVEALAGYRKMVQGTLQLPPENFNLNHWAALQVYIALGQFMASAAMLGIDTCPMEGILPAKYDELLNLTAEGYRTVVVCPAGYRRSGDKYSVAQKVRYPVHEVVKRV